MKEQKRIRDFYRNKYLKNNQFKTEKDDNY